MIWHHQCALHGEMFPLSREGDSNPHLSHRKALCFLYTIAAARTTCGRGRNRQESNLLPQWGDRLATGLATVALSTWRSYRDSHPGLHVDSMASVLLDHTSCGRGSRFRSLDLEVMGLARFLCAKPRS